MTGRRRALAAALALAVLLAAGPAPASAHTNHAAVDSQLSADGTLLVESAFLAEAGFVVVHAVSEDGSPGEPLGARYVPRRAGFRTAVTVETDPDAWGGGAREVWVVVHDDSDGDGEFDPGTDSALSLFGRVAGERATVAGSEAPAYVAAEQFAPPPADGSVSVVAAALPADGYLVLRRESDDGPGAVVGHVALSAGTHENVTVPLDEPIPGEDGTARLSARLYTDDGDGEFDSGADQLVRAGEEPVGTEFTVETAAGATTEEPAANTPLPTTPAVNTPTPETPVVNTPTPASTATDSAVSPGQDGVGPAAAVGALGLLGLLAARVARE